jgi:uncharacterized membrane protein YfhO
MSGAPGKVRVRDLRPGRIDIDVDSAAAALLVTTETYDDDWRAWDGATSLRVVRVNGDYLGVLVPAGRRTVVCRFSSRSTRQGVMVSLAGLLFTGIAAAVLRRRDGTGA